MRIRDEKKPPDENIFVANKEKAGKLCMFGTIVKIESKKMITKTKSKLEEKKPLDRDAETVTM